LRAEDPTVKLRPKKKAGAKASGGDTECAARLKVLADPTRLEVLEQLLHGARCVGELNEVLRIDQSLLSHHLRTLRDAGFVRAERDGKLVRYSLEPSVSAARGHALDLGCCQLRFP
jgi:ArsR family transcriptional regulator, nickel/cobalt-responsive transcriptional repressor